MVTPVSKSMARDLTPSAPPLRRRRTKLIFEKKLADDEFMAAAIGDVQWLKQSLKNAQAKVNFDKNGLAAIHLAALHGRLECLKLCIEKFKTDVNQPSSTGWRPIHLCISNQTGKRSLRCLIYLLENGALPSVENDDGITPAHQAASEGHVQCLKVLIELGAKIDSKDCRGNTPLDLAKLWGHRKCARILAAEMWHQDKAYVAKEIKQLKKIKMQHFLKELELDELITEKTEMELNAPKSGQVHSLGGYKPNSKTKQSDIKMDDKRFEKVKDNGATCKDSETKLANDDFNETFDDDSSQSEQENACVKPKNIRSYQSFYNSDHWNISTRVNENPYLPGLEDDYPRDEFTKMPKVKGAPKFYEGQFFSIMSYDAIDDDIKRKGTSAKLRKPKLPQDVINKALLKDHSTVARGMIFKCKHIGDVQTKKKFDSDVVGRTEAPFHLTNDVKSFLVKNSVILKDKPKTSSASSESSSKKSSLVWMDDNFPLPLVMQTMQNMSKPNIYQKLIEK